MSRRIGNSKAMFLGGGVALAALLLAVPALGASTAEPKAGHYLGHSNRTIQGHQPIAFDLTVKTGTCAAPGDTKAAPATCVTVSSATLVQSPCTDGFVNDEFFPVTEPIALDPAGKISHTWTLYSTGGDQTSDRPAAGAKKVGTFQLTLAIDALGTASGSMHYEGTPAAHGCDSGLVAVAAKLRK